MIIGLSGGMGVGKSTGLELLNEHFGRENIKLVKFAQPLYDMQEMIYRRIEQAYKRPSTFIKDRKLLQWLGTDWGRDTIRQSLWVDIWKEETKRWPDYIVVCDDVRFDNEADALRAVGGKVIKIVADRATDRITTANGLTAHASEAGLSPEKVDFVVANNGTIEQYKNNLLAAINEPAAKR